MVCREVWHIFWIFRTRSVDQLAQLFSMSNIRKSQISRLCRATDIDRSQQEWPPQR